MGKGDAAPPGKATPGAYVPPSLRGADDKGDGKGKGKDQNQDCSLRVTNLSEDCREGDLQDLFGQFGTLQRVFLAKDMDTYQSKGFAFVTYYTRKDAQEAIDKLHGHGYDNLILSVQFASLFSCFSPSEDPPFYMLKREWPYVGTALNRIASPSRVVND